MLATPLAPTNSATAPYGGQVGAVPRTGGGSTVTVHLPAASPQLPTPVVGTGKARRCNPDVCPHARVGVSPVLSGIGWRVTVPGNGGGTYSQHHKVQTLIWSARGGDRRRRRRRSQG